MPVFELRVAITAGDYDRLVTFYRDGMGLDPGATWTDNGRGQILHSGQGVIEVLDTEHAAHVDAMEVGHIVNGQIRFAFRIPDIYQAIENVQRHGATLMSKPALTPWNDLNARIISPDGMQITLFQVMPATQE